MKSLMILRRTKSCPPAALDKMISYPLIIKLKPPSICIRNIYIHFLQCHTLHLSQLLLQTVKRNCITFRTVDKAGPRAGGQVLLSPGG